MNFCYVIYSKSIDKFYVGETESLEIRLGQHNSSFFQGSFTSQAKDWELLIALECENREHARAVESHIKKMKSRVYITNLAKYEEMQRKLIDRYAGSGSR